MRLMIVRHGDPDYSIDSLTPKGWREAELLADRLCKLDIAKFYVSPLGRAKDTASFTLKRLGREAEEMTWMREFDAWIKRPDVGDRAILWDWLPEDWTKVSSFYDKDAWSDHTLLKEGTTEHGDIRAEYDWVIVEFDKLLERHGYCREGQIYRAENANDDTIVLFCHFGLECVLLSHLLGISPMVLWHGLCAAPTSVTTLYTEERRPGIASFRMTAFGDTSHLYVADEPPAFAARFCECYDHTDERHD